MIRLVLIVFLALLLIGMLPLWPYSTGWGYGYYPSGGVGLILLIVVVLLLLNNDKARRI